MNSLRYLLNLGLIYLSVGRGALVQHGEFWYPVRLLQLERGPGQERQWRVQYWRLNMYASGPPNSSDLVPVSRIVDELWQDQHGRRSIRVSYTNLALSSNTSP